MEITLVYRNIILSGLKAGLDRDFIGFTMDRMEPVASFLQLIHPKAAVVCHILQTAGHQAYIVGGCVRDLHLGLTPKDWDICTSASPEQVVGLFPKTIPTGIKHGTITVCMGEGVDNHFEVTTFRVEGKYLDGRRPEEVKFVQNVEEDLARRDFTINAMALDPTTGALIDPFDGLLDLQRGIIQAVGDANVRFQEDGLRIMRAARFAARFGYQIEENTLTGMKANLETLKKVSKERISDELCKILMSRHNSHGMMLLLQTGALGIACPLLNNTSVTKLKKLHQCNSDLETRLAVLYSRLPSKLVEQELTELKLSNKEVKGALFLLLTRASFMGFKDNGSVVSYRRFIARLKNEAPDPWTYTYHQFIGFANALGMPIKLLDQYQEAQVPARKDLAINGNDLLEIGIPAGPNLKYLLDGSYDEILEHPEHNHKDYLLGLIKKRL